MAEFATSSFAEYFLSFLCHVCCEVEVLVGSESRCLEMLNESESTYKLLQTFTVVFKSPLPHYQCVVSYDVTARGDKHLQQPEAGTKLVELLMLGKINY